MAVSYGLSVPSSGDGGGPRRLRVLDRACGFVEGVFQALAIAAVILVMVLTVANAILRKTIQEPIPGSLAMTLLYLMPALVFLGLGRVQAENKHIAATLVVDRLGPAGKRLCKLVVSAVIAAVVGLMVFGALGELENAWGKSIGGSPELPVGPSWLVVPLGLSVVLVRAVWQLVVLASGSGTAHAAPPARDAESGTSGQGAEDD